jgi:ABC-type branched-subunit amino acid transport system substrate-binding protein
MKVYLLVLVSVLFLTSCDNTHTIVKNGKTIQIGVLVPLSGKNKRFSQQSLAGLNAAKDMQTYLRDGTAVEFIILDTKSDLSEARKVFYTLKKQKVKAIISLMGSDMMLAMHSVFQENKIPVIVTLATDNKIVNLSDNIAQVCFTNKMQALVAAHYLRDEILLSNAAIIYDRSNHYSYALAKEFKKYYQSIGGKVDYYLSINTPKELNKFKNQKNIGTDTLYITTNVVMTLDIIKIMKQKFPRLKYISGDGLLSSAKALDKVDGSILDGVYVTEHYALNGKKDKKIKDLEKTLHKEGYDESSYAFLAYDGYLLLYSALNQCKDLKTQCINNSLQNSEIIHGSSGNFNIRDGEAQRRIFVDKIQDMKLYKEIVTY